MISGASEQELELANARANIIMVLDNTSTYESWLIIDTYIEKLENENQELKEEINKISKKELKVRDMLYSIEYGTLTRERLNQIEEVLFELGGDVDDEI